MATTEAILVFDIGKTNKKILLFNRSMEIIHESEEIFPEIKDDDGFACDDIDRIEKWILDTCRKLLKDPAYDIRAINFTTYGATLVYLDGDGKRLTPVYNYLKPMPDGVAEPIYEKYGGVQEFSRKTASPALGMLNSGLQAAWLKKFKPEVFEKVRSILHFPQYVSHLLTGQITAEHTSIGCHTALWDFDEMKYHDWVADEGISLSVPAPVGQSHPASVISSDIPVGIGIHDSSASLVPYFRHSDEEFILVSTGTWCISMNPFNHTPLTPAQLEQDCLAYMSIQQKPVKSSRLFLGHIHDVNVKYLAEFYGVAEDSYKAVVPDATLLEKVRKVVQENRDAVQGERYFFRQGVAKEYVDKDANLDAFSSFEEAYHRLILDLADLTASSIGLISDPAKPVRNLFITGGFAKNTLFTGILTSHFKGSRVYTSEIANATSLGAAMVQQHHFKDQGKRNVELGLQVVSQIS